MTTVSDAFGPADAAAISVGSPVDAESQPRAHARMRAREYRSLSVPGKVKSAALVVRADLAGAWPWHGEPPTLADLWATRVPAREQVPGENRILWTGWVAWNHLVLIPTAVIATALWILQHPARAGLAAVIAAPLIAMWLS